MRAFLPVLAFGMMAFVDSWLGISLDKGARFTDWARRPLDKRQIEWLGSLDATRQE